MGARVLFQLVLFLLPFLLFGVYRLAIAEAEQEGRKPWPIRVLFGVGLALAVGSWLIFIFLDRGGREECYRPTQIVDGVVVPGERYACEKDLGAIGIPKTEDPGGQADGVGRGLRPDPVPVQDDQDGSETVETPDR